LLKIEKGGEKKREIFLDKHPNKCLCSPVEGWEEKTIKLGMKNLEGYAKVQLRKGVE
jgi:hypothetical protein